MIDARDEDIFDTPEYPTEWDSGQRVAAYWHAVHHTGMPGNTKGWHSVLKSLLRESERRVSGTP